MAGIIQAKTFNEQKLAADASAGGVLDPTGVTKPTIHLFTNPFAFTSDAKLTDLTEATFVGYGPVNVAGWTEGFDRVALDQFITPTTVITFVAGLILADETAYGWFMLDPAGRLVMGETFATPVLFHAQFDTLLLTPKIYEGLFNGPTAFED